MRETEGQFQRDATERERGDNKKKYKYEKTREGLKSDFECIYSYFYSFSCVIDTLITLDRGIEYKNSYF